MAVKKTKMNMAVKPQKQEQVPTAPTQAADISHCKHGETQYGRTKESN